MSQNLSSASVVIGASSVKGGLILLILTYTGTSSWGTYPSLTRLGFRHEPSGLWLAGIKASPEKTKHKKSMSWDIIL